jgi:hypothetical protein
MATGGVHSSAKVGSEQQIHEALVARIAISGVKPHVVFHVPNQGKHTISYYSKLKRMGMRPGASDLVFCFRGRFHALELKTEGGRLSDHQDAFLFDVIQAGGLAEVAYGLDNAVEILIKWEILKEGK